MAQENKNLLLLKRIAENDSEALDILVRDNMGLVKSIVMRFKDRGVEYDDLVQIGSIGMIKAARSFDFSYDNAFSTYAVPLITGEILRYLRDDGPIKVSRSIKSKIIMSVGRLSRPLSRSNLFMMMKYLHVNVMPQGYPLIFL